MGHNDHLEVFYAGMTSMKPVADVVTSPCSFLNTAPGRVVVKLDSMERTCFTRVEMNLPLQGSIPAVCNVLNVLHATSPLGMAT